MSWKLSHWTKALIMFAAWSKGMSWRRGIPSVKAAIKMFPGWGGSIEVRPEFGLLFPFDALFEFPFM